MNIYLVKFSECGFQLDAVCVAKNKGDAIALLKLGADCKVDDEPEMIGWASYDSAPRVVTQDKLQLQ